MKIPNIPMEIIGKNKLLQKLKELKPDSEFDRILITDHGKPCAIIISIPDWTRISQKWNTLTEYVRRLREERNKRLAR